MGEETREMDTRDEAQLLHQLDRSNLDKSCFNVIVVGGWGHSYKHCPSQGGIDWRTLNGAGVPPSPDKGPNPMKNQ